MEEKDRTYIRQLFPAIGRIQDRSMQEKVISTWFHAWKRSNFARIENVHAFEPARSRIVYSNVDHTNQVWEASERLAESLKGLVGATIHMDELIAGVILHDVDKIVIFDAQTAGFTATGRQFAHAIMGASLAMMEGLPESVAHIIGAHSFRFSPTPPPDH